MTAEQWTAIGGLAVGVIGASSAAVMGYLRFVRPWQAKQFTAAHKARMEEMRLQAELDRDSRQGHEKENAALWKLVDDMRQQAADAQRQMTLLHGAIQEAHDDHLKCRETLSNLQVQIANERIEHQRELDALRIRIAALETRR